MRKQLIILMLAALCSFTTSTIAASTDSTATDSSDAKWKGEITLASRNVYRGVSYGESPSMQMMAAWMPCKYFETGTYGNYTTNGTKEGFGNQVNLYATIKPFASAKSALKNISFTADDFFYFYADDNANNYTDWTSKKTNHFIEARIKYDSRFDFTAGFVIFENEAMDSKGVYLEASYDFNKHFNGFVGYLTDRNDLMFHDAGGFTNVGGTVQGDLKFAVAKVSLIFSPTSSDHQEFPGVGRNPVSLVASLTRSF